MAFAFSVIFSILYPPFGSNNNNTTPWQQLNSPKENVPLVISNCIWSFGWSIIMIMQGRWWYWLSPCFHQATRLRLDCGRHSCSHSKKVPGGWLGPFCVFPLVFSLFMLVGSQLVTDVFPVFALCQTGILSRMHPACWQVWMDSSPLMTLYRSKWVKWVDGCWTVIYSFTYIYLLFG